MLHVEFWRTFESAFFLVDFGIFLILLTKWRFLCKIKCYEKC